MASKPVLSAWSYSKLRDFETCAAKFHYKHILKLPDPPTPALEDGTRIHNLISAYLRGQIPSVPDELAGFRAELEELRSRKVLTEREWCFNILLERVEWMARDAWLRIKLDAVRWDPPNLWIYDWKTGRPREEDHAQLDLYALGGFLRSPEVQVVMGELWYVLAGTKYPPTVGPKCYYRDRDFDPLLQTWSRRSKDLLEATIFPPSPGRHCRFCAWNAGAGGPCTYDADGSLASAQPDPDGVA